MHSNSSRNDGKCFINGFFILKCAIWAQIIKNAINDAGIRTNEGNHIPTTRSVDNEILVAPTRLRVKSDNPNCLNSFTIFSKRNIQTVDTDMATIN